MDKYAALNWKGDQHPYQKAARDACRERVDWQALCAYASSLNNNKPCNLLNKCTAGGMHLIKILEFKDADTQWIVRVQIEPSTPKTAAILRAEIAAMELIRARAPRGLPVPQIFGYELDDANTVRAAFMLMEFIPGSSAMDADGGYEGHHGRIPAERTSSFYREMASIQVWQTV
jgi:aminoglycoside phosphotransferase (APT) family kinase protein